MKIAAIYCRLFHGEAFDVKIPQIADEHKIAAAKALATFVENPNREHIISSAFDQGIADVVAKTVKSV